MPSKAKKKAKTPPKLSDSEMSVSSSSVTSPAPQQDFSEDTLSRSLKEASKKFPSLIGKSAIVAYLTDVEPQSKGGKVWLSEASMVASSIAPGSTVSVSLFSRNMFSSSFPLSSLADECARYFGLESQEQISDEAGNYFALATVFPSCKILKDGMRLSSNVSFTMGCPASGSILFVYPIQSQSQTDFQGRDDKWNSTILNSISIYSPKELCLELVPSKNGLKNDLNMVTPAKCPPKAASDRIENGLTSSPKTPSLNQSKLLSSSSTTLSLPISAALASSISDKNCASFNSADIYELLQDERAKELLQSCANSWLYSRPLLWGNLVTIPLLSDLCIFRVGSVDKSSAEFGTSYAVIVSDVTKVLFLHQNSAFETLHESDWPHRPELMDVETKVGSDAMKLGGLFREYEVLKDIISSSIQDTLSSLGLRPTKGVLLHGPPGTGKTSLARLCCRDAGISLFSVNGPEIVSQYYGESEKALREAFDSAHSAAPAVVFIDELDAIAPARKEGGDELSQRMVATLLNLMDGINQTVGVLVIAATNRPDSIEPALRRPGRLDREVEIGVPSPTQRLDILLTLLSEMDHCLLDPQVQQLAIATHGFVGADLAALCNEAAMVCLRRHVKESRVHICSGTSIVCDGCSDSNFGDVDGSKDVPDVSSRNHTESASSPITEPPASSNTLSSFHVNGMIRETSYYIKNGLIDGVEQSHPLEENNMLKIDFDDFEKARRKVRPSAMREVILEVPKVKWEDVGGQMEVKTQLMEAVEWPQKHKDAFKRIGTRPPTGVLMFGPPGCSKTLMARAVASEAGLNFLAVKGPELFSKWVGESEKAVRSLFAKARANAPSIIFFDEIDGLAVTRGKESDGISVADRVMTQLLVELDGLHQRVDVTVIAATNRPDKIDPALLRPGRFDRLLYVGLPNAIEREDIFRIHLRGTPYASDVNVKELACLTEGCTGADISLICREATVVAIEENCHATEITMEHLKAGIRQVQPSEVQSFHELSAKFRRLVHSNVARDECGHQISPHQCNNNTLWSQMKSIMLPFYHFPAALLAAWAKFRSSK